MSIYKLGDIIQINKEIITEIKAYKYIELGNIKNRDYKIINQNNWIQSAKWLINEKMILIGKVRPINQNNGLIIPEHPNALVASSAFICFKNNEKIKLNYLWYLLNRRQFIDYMISRSRGTTYPTINTKDILEYRTFLPNLNTQQKIIDIIEPIIKIATCLKNIINLLKKTSNLIQTLGGYDCKIKDLVTEINKGFSYRKKHINNDGAYKIFNIKNIKYKNSYNRTNYVNKNLLKIGSIVTALYGSTLGSTAIIIEKNWVLTRNSISFESIYSLQIQETIIRNNDKIMMLANGSAQKFVKDKDVLNLKIKMNNMKTLKQISEIYIILLRINLILDKIKSKLIDILIK